MKYTSTRGNAEPVDSVRAVLNGLAGDGGLTLPERFPEVPEEFYRTLLGRPFTEMAEEVFRLFLDDFPDIPGIVRRAYSGKFDTPEITPVKKVGDRYVLELFHGPTSAFKDVALSALPVLMSDALTLTGSEEDLLILTATSGDTGKAAMEGFRDVPRVRIFVFYPYGGVSPVQEKQMTSALGENVRAIAIRGNFDDAQTAVKSVFSAHPGVLPGARPVRLSSANSINIGRLVPQITYYFKAYSDLVTAGEIRPGDRIAFTVPTGNFGDVLAGVFAKKLGLPVERFIIASNENDVLTEFFRTGVYDRRRTFFRTSSPSMDILVSSNLERMLYLASDGNASAVRMWMKELSENGFYEVDPRTCENLSALFFAGSADDVETAETIREVYRQHGYLLDPHTAVGWFVSETESAREGEKKVPMVVLSTASPYKFPAAVLGALGETVPEDPFIAMEVLREKTGVPVPANLASLREKPVRFTDVIEKEKISEFVEKEI